MNYILNLHQITPTEVGISMEYVVIFEKGENSYGASVPDLPGCIAVAKTMAEVRGLIAEAIEFHIEGLREDGEVDAAPTGLKNWGKRGSTQMPSLRD